MIGAPGGEGSGTTCDEPQSGWIAPPLEVIWRSPLPSAPIAHKVEPNGGVAVRWKTICVPSGDHEGWAFAYPSLVSCCSPEPSAFATKSSPGKPPALLREKTIRVPSGDHDGPAAYAPSALTRCGSEPSMPTTPIPSGPTYASRRPSGDQAGS